MLKSVFQHAEVGEILSSFGSRVWLAHAGAFDDWVSTCAMHLRSVWRLFNAHVLAHLHVDEQGLEWRLVFLDGDEAATFRRTLAISSRGGLSNAIRPSASLTPAAYALTLITRSTC
jgi:hypothetical protein